MMERTQIWWRGLSVREKVLIGVMIALLGATLVVFGIALPVDRALRESRREADAAIDLNASIRSKVAFLRRLPRRAPPRPALADAVIQTAGEAGLTLERNQAQGGGRTEIAIAAAAPSAAFRWIGALEARGVVVESVTLRPAPAPGAVTVSLVVREVAQ